MAHKTLRIPTYFKQFKCIGGACEDSCCIGWQIPIDEITYKKYKKVKHPVMRKRLDKELVAKKNSCSPEYVAKIKLKNNRCAFLTKQGWCDLYSELGEAYLSQTCTLYPRTIHQIGGQMEGSLTFSCPEALRCMLLAEQPIAFEEIPFPSHYQTVTANISFNQENPKVWQDYFVMIRAMLIKILQYRERDFEQRMRFVEAFMKALDQHVKRHTLKKIPSLIAQYDEQLTKSEIRLELQDLKMLSREGIKLLGEIREITTTHKVRAERYLQVLEWVEQGLLGGEAQYVKGYEIYYKPFAIQRGYMLENYFVNYIIERCVPVDGQTPIESLNKLLSYEKLIRLHLIGLGINKEAITTEDLVLCIQAISKTFDHHEGYYDLLVK
ncbi:MAG: flagellin lysine-N-methylase [Cellulosilyticaceae bacterium]